MYSHNKCIKADYSFLLQKKSYAQKTIIDPLDP